MRLCAASRPVSILPDNNTVSPGLRLRTSSGVMVSRLTRVACAPPSKEICGQLAISGGVCSEGPEPSNTKWVWRVAAQFGIMQTGKEAAWVG